LSAQHILTASSWFDAGKRLADLTQDPQAIEVIQFLGRRLTVGMAKEDRIVRLNSDPSNATVLIPVIGVDKLSKLGQLVKTPAMYMGEMDILVIDGDLRISPILMGICLLHEGLHALEAERNPILKEVAGTQQGWEHERDVVEFQNRLMQVVGGPGYELLMNRHISNLRRHYASIGELVGTKPMGSDNLPLWLEELFGPAATSYEATIRHSFFITHAQMELVSQDRPNEAQQLQTQIVQGIAPTET